MRARSLFLVWLPFAVFATGLALGSAIIGQTLFRQSANDFPLQMAEDATRLLSTGVTVSSVVPTNEINITQSLAPFMVVYDQDGKPVAGNARLAGALPELSPDLRQYALEHSESRLTWQPSSEARSAVVIRPYRAGEVKGTVLAGRSLRLVEERIADLRGWVAVTWFATLFGTAVILWIVSLKHPAQLK